MNEYDKQKANLEAIRCKDCGGLGYKDDAGLGDIFYKTWECPTCKGTGIKVAVEELK
jgi:DnaJ-class molecular chaperone